MSQHREYTATPVEEIIVEGLFENFHKICFIKNMYCVTCENKTLPCCEAMDCCGNLSQRNLDYEEPIEIREV